MTEAEEDILAELVNNTAECAYRLAIKEALACFDEDDPVYRKISKLKLDMDWLIVKEGFKSDI